ncbi:hypothetical protein ACQ4LE_001924 [Meloidogyne hapla]
MLSYKSLQSKQLNRVIFSFRLQSSLPNRNARLPSKPSTLSFRDMDKRKQQPIEDRRLKSKQSTLSFWNIDKRQEARQTIADTSSGYRSIHLIDRMLEFTISNKSGEPVLSIDELHWKPSIGNDSLQKSELEKRIGYIHMPVKQARLLIQRIYKLSEVKFQVDKSLSLLSMDRWTETPLESGLLQQLYTHRIPGMLHGEKQQAYYLSVLRFKTLRHSEGSTSLNKSSKESIIFEQEITKKPFIYISQHALKPNVYHIWDQGVFTIEVPISKVLELACKIDALLTSSEDVVKYERDEKAKEKIIPKPRFDLNNKDPISYFATPIGTPQMVKQIIRRPSIDDMDQRRDKPIMNKELDKPKIFSYRNNRSTPQHSPTRSGTRPKQFGHASIFSEKLKEALTIRNAIKGRST